MSDWLLCGTYTTRESEGIYSFGFDEDDGTPGAAHLAAKTVNPSFVLVHLRRPFVYAVNELWEFEGRPGGGVSAFAFDRESGVLEELNTALSHGADPCHLSIDTSGKFLFVSNFGSGSVSVLPLQEDGRLEQASDVVEHSGRGMHPRRQAGPHIHATLPMPGGRFVLTTDLGLDEIVVYELSAANGALRRHGSVKAAAGSGPRHMAQLADAGMVLVSNELDSSLANYRWDGERGELHPLGGIPCGEGEAGLANSAADLHVSPEGRVYVSNRGEDTIAAFAVDGETGAFTAIGRAGSDGAKPRAFRISPSGGWLVAANQDSDSAVTFRIDRETGQLARHGDPVRIPSPTWLAWA